MTRRRRRLAAWFGILGLAFGQFAVTAHACLTGAPAHSTAVKAVVMGHEGHCGGGQSHTSLAPVANACELQCTDGAPSVAALDLPTVMLAVLPVAPLPAVLPLPERARDSMLLAAIGAQPPPHLQFGRFLN